MLTFIICLLATVIVHEFAHLIVALLYKTKVKTFCIGFWKPYLSYKFKGIDFRITPWLLGGFCDIAGMDNRRSKKYFLTKPYYQKFQMLIAGVVINFIIACICYLINYGSISLGIQIDWALIKGVFTQEYLYAFSLMPYDTNFFLLQLSLLNLFCAIGNLVPIPPLDGGLLWFYLVYDKMNKKVRKRIIKIGWFLVIGIQALLIFYIYFDWIVKMFINIFGCIVTIDLTLIMFICLH